ncbi:hypothetical protein PISMIDRAFT_674932, partial [Pisolithus microcarpus 441]
MTFLIGRQYLHRLHFFPLLPLLQNVTQDSPKGQWLCQTSAPSPHVSDVPLPPFTDTALGIADRV